MVRSPTLEMLPPTINGKPLKMHVMHAIVASLEMSDLKQLVGSEVLCSLLNAWYLNYFNGTTVDMSYLWPTLVSEPSVSFETAALPVVIFFLARSYHGLDVRLPSELMNHPTYHHLRKQAARRIRAGDAFRKTFHKVERTCRSNLEEETMARFTPSQPLRTLPKARTSKKPGRAITGILASGIIIAAVALAVFSML